MTGPAFDEFAAARQRTDDEARALAVVDKLGRRRVLDRLRPTLDADQRARAEATVAHFREADHDATA